MSDTVFLKSVLQIQGKPKDINSKWMRHAQVALVLPQNIQASFFKKQISKAKLIPK